MRLRQMLLRGALVVGLAGTAVGVTAGTAQAVPGCANLWTQLTYYNGLGSVQYGIGVSQRNAGNYTAAQIAFGNATIYFGFSSSLAEQYRAASCQEP